MEKGTDTPIEKKSVLKKCMTVVYVLLGVVAAPFVFILAFDHARDFERWGYADESFYLVPPLLAIIFGVAWSVFAIVGWKRGNVGLRIGLSVVVWSFVTGVVCRYYAGLLWGPF